MTNAIMKVLSSIICLSLALLSGALAFYGRPDIPVGAVKGDRFSPLDGPALVKAKVKALYVMGGGRVARSVSKGSVEFAEPFIAVGLLRRVGIGGIMTQRGGNYDTAWREL